MASTGPTSTSRRQLLERYTHVREDHLRYMQKWGLIRPDQHVPGESSFTFPDLAVIRQAEEALSEGLSFRAVLRKLIAVGTAGVRFPYRGPAGEGVATQAA